MRTSTGNSSWSAWKQINHIGTNLGITAGTTAGPIVTSSTGTGATLPTASATASGVVTTGDQTWAGIKTFSSPVVVATPTGPTHAATKAYVDSAIVNIGIGGYVPTSRTISTTNGITGGGDLTANRTLSLDSTVIRTTGNQTLGGTKTFSSAVVLSTAGTATTHAVRADRTISTTNGISGGGDLTANRTLSLDSTVVRTTGNQTLAGTKTFSSPVVVATPTGTTHATTKGYVDSAVGTTTTSFSVTAGNWYTIATNPGSRAYATFEVWDTTSGQHGSMQFNAGVSYGNQQATITMLGKSWFGSGGIFNNIRIRGTGTYDTHYLQIYATANGTLFVRMHNNIQSSGWTLASESSTGDPGSGTFAEIIPNNSSGISTNRSGYIGGNLGVGQTSPSYKLDVSGTGRFTSTVEVGTPTSGSHAATKAYVDGGFLKNTGDITLTGNLNMATYKLTVGTIDPLFNINGKGYATYAPSMIGVKEESTGVIKIGDSNCKKEDGLISCSYEIKFDEQKDGSDLWIFRKITDFGEEWKNLEIILTPNFDGSVWYRKLSKENKIIVSAKIDSLNDDENLEISYRLTASRFDYKEWSNMPEGANLEAGFIIK